jgi:formylglycine-generating enzyme required for sulfatase activity
MPEGYVDPVLQRLNRELPGMVPRYGTRWEQYLLSWQPAIDDEGGALRGKLRALRKSLRDELGILSRQVLPTWDRRIRVEHFWFLYEKDYLDAGAGAFRVEKYLADARADFGDIDAVCLWQSYPRLGLDPRNQFDYYRDLPGGTPELLRVVETLQGAGVKVFLNYNPWDTGTRREQKSDAETLAWFLESTGADGVFLDTIESADRSVLETLKKARADVAVCPELIPPLPDLPVVSGCWQQFTPPDPPHVLSHRWLDPGFCPRFIDRYARAHGTQVAKAFLHGTGHVVWENVFGWWNPWNDADRLLLKKTSIVLRALEPFFLDPDWEPYVPTGRPGVWAMEWHSGDSALFTLFNGTGQRCDGIEIAIPERCPPGLTDVWNGRELSRGAGGRSFTCALGPGEVGCVVAGTPPAALSFPSDAGDSRRHRPVTLGAYEPRPVPRTAERPAAGPARDMVPIPGGRYVMKVRRACEAVMEGGTYADISHPTAKEVPDQLYWMDTYEMDRTPVSKASFQDFIGASRYRPVRLHNFLADWVRPPGTEDTPERWAPPDGRRDHPVTWVSLDDARAYALWAGLQLPTEAQWQRGAEGPRAAVWPWGDQFDPARCNCDSPYTTSVTAFPSGASAEGFLDMCGNTWEWTESERDDGHMRYVMVRGGCHLRVTGSIWYTASGAQPCGVHEKVPLLGAGIDRLSTVGFRCVRARP